MSPGSHDLKLVKGFILQTESVPRSMRLSKARGDSEMGGMSYCTQPYGTKKKKKKKLTVLYTPGSMIHCTINLLSY